MIDELKFEADLIAWTKWPKYSRGILLTLLLLSVIGIVCNGLYSWLTDGLVSATLPYSFGLALLVLLVGTIFAAIYGIRYKVIGKLTIDDKQIATTDKTFPLDSLENVTVSALSYKGQKYNSDASDGDGVSFITIKQNETGFEYAYIINSQWHLADLDKFISKINVTTKRELFTKSSFTFGQSYKTKIAAYYVDVNGSR